jgi:hypothetical protein
VVPTAHYTKAVGDRLRLELETLLGLGAHVRVATVGSIERTPSGRRVAIMSRIAQLAARRTGDPL